MKCLTICQPWAAAIIHGWKRHENRTWPTKHRGPVLIHAGASANWYTSEAMKLVRPGLANELLATVRGYIIGVAELVNCTDDKEARLGALERELAFISGPVCWHLKRPRPFASPIPFKGQLGLFDVPDELVAEAIAASGKVCA